MINRISTKSLLFTTLITIEIFGIILVGISLREYIYPTTFAIILVYISLPAIEFLEKKCRLPRSLAVGLIFILQLLVIITITLRVLPFIIKEMTSLLRSLPQNAQGALNSVKTIAEQNGITLYLENGLVESKVRDFFDNLSKLDINALKRTFAIAQGTANQLIGYFSWIINIILIPILYFFIGIHYDQILKCIETYTPSRHRKQLSNLLQDLNTILSSFLRGELLLVTSLAICYIIGFNSVGVPNPTTLGIITGLLSFIPFIGSFTGMTLATLSLYAVQGSTFAFAGLGLTYLIIGTLESLILIPYFIGNSLGMSTFTSLIVLIIATKEIGAIGLILGIPIAAILKHLFLSFAEVCKREQII